MKNTKHKHHTPRLTLQFYEVGNEAFQIFVLQNLKHHSQLEESFIKIDNYYYYYYYSTRGNIVISKTRDLYRNHHTANAKCDLKKILNM